MGNAPDHVKAAAQHVTDTNNDDGWARAVRALVLPQLLSDTAPGESS